ncbi:unnamed protein product [Gemmataceae bacterium]|nr:unnamed protein product [Gemmataceae bacterium]VTT98881.1 unnamed protein product [Gemmataceae bacterium]
MKSTVPPGAAGSTPTDYRHFDCDSTRYDDASPSQFGIVCAAGVLRPGLLCVVLARVSGREQARSGNLRTQRRDVCNHVRNTGAVVVGHLEHVGVGVDAAYVESGDHTLARAAVTAKLRGATHIVVESMSRALRPAGFARPRCVPWTRAKEERRRNAGYLRHDLARLNAALGGIVLVTLADPDAPPPAERAAATRRGLNAVAAQRMSRPQSRAALLPRVMALHRDGCSTRDIATDIGIDHTRVWRWIARERRLNAAGTCPPTNPANEPPAPVNDAVECPILGPPWPRPAKRGNALEFLGRDWLGPRSSRRRNATPVRRDVVDAWTGSPRPG